MQINVFFNSTALTPAELNGSAVLVIDVLRASTTIAVALANGARKIIPFESAEEAVTRSKAFERSDVRLAGERRMLPIPGFDLGNSPGEFTTEAVRGKTILLATSNGTVVLAGTHAARATFVGSYVNFSAALAVLRGHARRGDDIAILCAGSERQFALEDAACAGRFVRGLGRRNVKPHLNDAAVTCLLLEKRLGGDIPALLERSSHGRALVEAGFVADLAVCAALDTHPVVPVHQDRQITRLDDNRER